jgi:hypothetical protein
MLNDKVRKKLKVPNFQLSQERYQSVMDREQEYLHRRQELEAIQRLRD